MKQNYSVFLQRMIDKYEGGYGWHPDDKGGPTKYGITCYRLAEYRGEKMDSMARWASVVQAMTRQEAENIYKKYYADPVLFHLLPSGVDCCVFDYGANSGPGRAMSVARAIVGAVDNNDLLNKLDSYDRAKFVDQMCAERLRFMKGIRGGYDWSKFGKGWQARVADLRAYCNALIAKKTPDPAIDLSNVPTPKTYPTQSKPMKEITQGASGSAAGGGSTWASGLGWRVAVGVFVAGVAAACVYAYWRYRQSKRENAIIVPT